MHDRGYVDLNSRVQTEHLRDAGDFVCRKHHAKAEQNIVLPGHQPQKQKRGLHEGGQAKCDHLFAPLREAVRIGNAERAKYEIHNAVKDALKVADSWQKFKNELAKRGVCLELVYKDKERTKVQGIRFSNDGYSFKGTQISRDYSFGKLNARFEGTENHVSARAISTQQYEQGSFKDELLSFMSESSQNPWNGISSIGLFAPANAQTFEQFPEDESSKKKKKKRRRGFSL